MFYSNDILQNPEYGVSTLWRVGTVGASKVTRKAMQEVDVQKACKAILQPAAPLALRIQGNLLYGLTRIFEQQCSLVLGDAERTQAEMQLFYQKIGRSATDSAAGKVRRENILLPDDPNFILDPIIPAFDFDSGGNMVYDPAQSSSRKDFSQLSLAANQSISSGLAASMMELNISQSDESNFRLTTPLKLNSSARKNTLNERTALVEEVHDLDGLGDVMFDIDAEGNITGIADPFEEPQLPELPAPLGQHIGDEMMIDQDQLLFLDEDGQRRFAANNDDILMLDGEPFPRVHDAQQQHQLTPADRLSAAQQVETAATAKRRASRGRNFLDSRTLISNEQRKLIWDEYLDRSAKEREKSRAINAEQARANAYSLILEQGINGIGQGDLDMDINLIFDDDNIMPPEMGMEEQSALEDHMSSSLMPWNRTPSAHRPSSVVGFGSKQRGGGSRQVTASPKGSIQSIERQSDIAFDRHRESGVNFAPGQTMDSSFEGLDVGADINRQEVDDSQLIRKTLDSAGNDFLHYATEQAKETGLVMDRDPKESRMWIEFKELARPGQDNKEVAAQAFYHVLALATKSLITVDQEMENNQPYGTIRLGIEVDEDEMDSEASEEADDAEGRAQDEETAAVGDQQEL
ncbi:hypothetical protein ACHAQA_006780 [Verticillium albo-atrum]